MSIAIFIKISISYGLTGWQFTVPAHLSFSSIRLFYALFLIFVKFIISAKFHCCRFLRFVIVSVWIFHNINLNPLFQLFLWHQQKSAAYLISGISIYNCFVLWSTWIYKYSDYVTLLFWEYLRSIHGTLQLQFTNIFFIEKHPLC